MVPDWTTTGSRPSCRILAAHLMSGWKKIGTVHLARTTFINALVLVTDVRKSLLLYCDILGQRILQDHGSFVQLENGLALHDGAALQRTIYGDSASDQTAFGRGNLVLYFDCDDLAAMHDRIAPDYSIIHSIKTQAWGQMVFRFYDHDGHIVEIGEPQ
jgi:catechol 2,3-dioxygenase-like lactoylglutathione lyase family enzyme